MHMDWHYPPPPATTTDLHNPSPPPCHTYTPLTFTPLLHLPGFHRRACTQQTQLTHTPQCAHWCLHSPAPVPPPRPFPHRRRSCTVCTPPGSKVNLTALEWGAPDQVLASSLGADSLSPGSKSVLWASVPLFIEGCFLLPNLKGSRAGSDFAHEHSA